MTKPTSWKEVVLFIQNKPENKGKILKDILKEAASSSIWQQIKKNKKKDVSKAPAKKATKGKRGKKAMKGGMTELERMDIAQRELYGGVNKAENVVQRPGMPVGGSEKGEEHSLMQQGAGKQLAAEAGMIDALTRQQGGRRRRGRTARKSRKASKAKRSGRKHRKTARKTRKNRKSARKHRN